MCTFLSQIKLASVKLAMKYMKRVSAELEAVGGGPEEEELIVQGVRFAFRVHQVKKRNKIFSFKYYAVNFERFHFADLGCRFFFFSFFLPSLPADST